MLVAPFKVVLDANVLYPFTLRDTLLRAAAAGFFQAYWSALLLEEATRNLVADSIITPEQAERLRAAMDKAFPEALVTGHESLIAAMKNDEKDRHVAAAAVKAGAQVIVTMNLSDFRDLPDGIEAQHPDEFLSNLFDLDGDSLTEIVQGQAADLKKPPRTFEDIVGALAKLVPDFAAAVLKHAKR
ncbi:MAG: PIN domain-containing protein [Myxococcales bacterium]|nr:PIN domain-containing protein [Myxococcales bacterium]